MITLTRSSLLSPALLLSWPAFSQSVEEELKAFARAEYPDDHAVQSYVYDRQLAAKERMK